MGRIIGIDFGTKRIGLAVTDPLQLIASGLTTVSANDIWEFLDNYIDSEDVEGIVIGEPLQTTGEPSKIHHLVVGFVRKCKKRYPNVSVFIIDERYTSIEAERLLRQEGGTQRQRRDKGLIDRISAILILESYMRAYKGWN